MPAGFEFELNASEGLAPELSGDGSIEFRDEGGDLFATLPAPVLSDDAGVTAGPPTAAYQLHPAPEGGWRLTLSIDPQWLSAPKRVSNSASVICALEASGSAKTAAAPTNSDHFCNLVRMSVPL